MSLQWSQKYKINSLDDVIGQEHVIKNLKNRFKLNNIPNVLLFIGKTGTGKSSLAHIVSMAIVCDHPDEKGYPCLKCSSCQDILEEKFQKSVKQYNCSNINIDEMRNIESKAQSWDFTGKPKVFILDEFQEITEKASKNFLEFWSNKNLKAYFIINSMSAYKVPQAVQRRGQVFNLIAVSFDKIVFWLNNILQKENIKYPKEFIDSKTGGLFTIAQNCDGSPAVALSNLEQIAYSELWTDDQIRETLNFYSESTLMDVLKGCINKDESKVFKEQWTSKLFLELRTLLLELYKVKLSISFFSFRKDILQSLSQGISIERLKYILTIFFDLDIYKLTSDNYIEFYILQAIWGYKEEKQRQVLNRGSITFS